MLAFGVNMQKQVVQDDLNPPPRGRGGGGEWGGLFIVNLNDVCGSLCN